MTSPPGTDISDVGRLLTVLIEERGQALLDNRRRILGLLRDKAPDARRAIGMLMTAFDHGVPHRLRHGDDEASRAREAELLSERSGMSSTVAREVITAWTSAVARSPANMPETVQEHSRTDPISEADTSGVAPAASLPESAPGSPPPAQPLPPASPLPAIAPPSEPEPAPPPVDRARNPRKSRFGLGLIVAGGTVLVLGALGVALYAIGVLPFPLSPSTQTTSNSSTPASTPPSTAPQMRVTPEGYAVVSNASPVPSLQTKKARGDSNSLVVNFGVLVDGQPISFEVGVSFKRGQRHGTGFIKAFKDGQTASTGNIKVVRAEFNEYVTFEVNGAMVENPISAPNLCVTFFLRPMTITRIAVADGSFMDANGRYASGVCGGPERYGMGNLR